MINNKLTEVVCVRFDKKTMVGITMLAEDWKMKPSQLARYLISEYLRKKGVM